MWGKKKKRQQLLFNLLVPTLSLPWAGTGDSFVLHPHALPLRLTPAGCPPTSRAGYPLHPCFTTLKPRGSSMPVDILSNLSITKVILRPVEGLPFPSLHLHLLGVGRMWGSQKIPALIPENIIMMRYPL